MDEIRVPGEDAGTGKAGDQTDEVNELNLAIQQALEDIGRGAPGVAQEMNATMIEFQRNLAAVYGPIAARFREAMLMEGQKAPVQKVIRRRLKAIEHYRR